MRIVVLASVLVLSISYSVVQISRLRKFCSGKAVMPSSMKAFSLMKRSFVAIWFTFGFALALILEWKPLHVGLCLVAGVGVALCLQLLTKASGLMTFIEAGEKAIAARRAGVRDAGKSGSLFLIRSNQRHSGSKIVPARADWIALLQLGDRVRSTAS